MDKWVTLKQGCKIKCKVCNKFRTNSERLLDNHMFMAHGKMRAKHYG